MDCIKTYPEGIKFTNQTFERSGTPYHKSFLNHLWSTDDVGYSTPILKFVFIQMPNITAVMAAWLGTLHQG